MFEPVLHSSRWVEEEKQLPLSAVIARIHLRNWNWISLDQVSVVESFEFQDNWAGPTSKSLSGISGISVQSRYNSSGITTRNRSAVELTSHTLEISRRLSRSYIQIPSKTSELQTLVLKRNSVLGTSLELMHSLSLKSTPSTSATAITRKIIP